MIVNFEGFDNVGKTTLITQLLEKYQDLQAYCFPTPELKAFIKKPSIETASISELMEYHYLFIKDFADSQDKVKELSKKHTLLIDRYFYSNYAYFLKDFIQYCVRKKIPLAEAKEFGIHVDQILCDIYSYFVQPDLVIYLSAIGSPDYDFELVCGGYDIFFETERPKDFERVRALAPYTFEVVESALKKRGYI